MEKKELFKKIKESDKELFTKKEVNSIITSVTVSYKSLKPLEFRTGDVVYANTGGKRRPCVIIKVREDVVYAMPLSSTEDELNTCRFNCRFFGEGFICLGLIPIKIDFALDNYIGVFTDRSALACAKASLINIVNSTKFNLSLAQ